MTDKPHINAEGEFQSDKYPTCPPGKVPLSVKDPSAQGLLWLYAQLRRPVDAEFAADLEFALKAAGYDPLPGLQALRGVAVQIAEREKIKAIVQRDAEFGLAPRGAKSRVEAELAGVVADAQAPADSFVKRAGLEYMCKPDTWPSGAHRGPRSCDTVELDVARDEMIDAALKLCRVASTEHKEDLAECALRFAAAELDVAFADSEGIPGPDYEDAIAHLRAAGDPLTARMLKIEANLQAAVMDTLAGKDKTK